MEWLGKQHEVASKGAPPTMATEVKILECDKGKRNIVNNKEAEKSYNFKGHPFVQKVALEIKVKRKQCDRRNMERQGEKGRMEETEKELHELKEKLRKEQEMHRKEKEAQQEKV